MAATPAVQRLRQHVEQGDALSCEAVNHSAQPFTAVLLRQLFPRRPLVIVTAGLKTQEIFHQDIQTWLTLAGTKTTAKETVRTHPGSCFFPAWEILPHESKLPHVDVISDRLETLAVLLSPKPAVAPLVVTNVIALLQKTFLPADLTARLRTLRRGDHLEPLDLVEWLETQAYEPEAQVTHKGELSLRGGILDVWSPTSPWPVRLEFFGNELDSLRYFDPASQISREEISTADLGPAGELGMLRKAEMEGGQGTGTLLDYLPKEAVIILAEPEALAAHAEDYEQQIPAGASLFLHWKALQAEMEKRGLTVLSLSEDQAAADPFPLEITEPFQMEEAGAETISVESGKPTEDLILQGLEVFRPIGERAPEAHIAEAQRRDFFAQLHRWQRQGYRVHVVCNNAGERQRFEEIWNELGFGQSPQNAPAHTPAGPPLALHLGALARGFLSEAGRVVVVTDAEIFGRYKVQRPRRLKSPHAQTTRSLLSIDFTELEFGDYVVHLQYGIGRYLGLQKTPPALGRRHGTEEKAGQSEECLVIEYAPSDPEQPAPKLYVPVSEAHLVSKYVGAGKVRPPLNTLSGTRWKKSKEQAEKAVRDLAAEFLAIQAARESQSGHAFPEDTPWQREFESSFLYEETPDQWKAIQAAKSDMEKPKPMDRLICGDVGYGKTEVAIRAAFKAVMSGKQVAILVPTTVLAQQHYNTFRERMSDYPVRVELLSRFRSRREQTKVIENLAAGAADIVIGTHRLVQNDIVFKDLGLVIVDEEQRFGVVHKEKFKLMRRLVDVLTLSATPIPRTLYLALAGARDMSTIETPPQDRLPVETTVTPYDERVIRDAIRREMNRQGQVFFLHNRVSSIEMMAIKLQTLVPEARIVVGHGQMDPDDLEKVMTKFVNGEADVLLSTTIIESGLDIPNANTIIIDRADRFGLSELYQLRGRVGRYKHQAYAHLLIPRHAGLLSDARKRISAIKQYSSLGSGFKIAMRDLEIRGAGNLLGAQQSGHITAVGFDLYCQLLSQSVARLKGEKVKTRVEVQVRLDFVTLHQTENSETNEAKKTAALTAKKAPILEINVPRETMVYADEHRGKAKKREPENQPGETPRASAGLPFDYIADSKHRVEIYRKLATATDKSALETLKKQLADRFGPLPETVQLLMQIIELKLLAAEKDVTLIEVEAGKLKLLRNGDFLMLDGKYPRLVKREVAARISELKRFLTLI